MAVTRRKDSHGRVLPEGVSERVDGRYIYRYQQYGVTRYMYDKDLNKLKEKIKKHELDVTMGVNKDIARLCLDEWYPQYISLYKKGKVKEASLANLVNYYEWYIKNTIVGKTPMKELRRVVMISHFQYLADHKKLARSTLKSLASMIYNALQQVVYEGDLLRNPAVNIMKEIVAKPAETRDTLTVEQTTRLINYVKQEGWQNIYYPFIGIALNTGMRCGELLSLTWEDIDFRNHQINVNKTIHYRDKGNKVHEFFITTPKTAKANRSLPMSKEIEELFIQQRQYQKIMKIRDDITIDGYSNFIFTSKLGKPFTHEGLMRSIKTITKRANEKEIEKAAKEKREPILLPDNLSPHMFRHTFCTRLIEKKIPYEILQKVMGHANIRTTIQIYTHIKEDTLKNYMDGIGNVVDI